MIEDDYSYEIQEHAKEMWTLQEALDLCKKIEAKAPEFGYHVGLTGGCLYKDGPRKDIDIIFYPHNSTDNIQNKDGLIGLLGSLNVFITGTFYGWLKKATFGDKKLDLFFLDRVRDSKGNYGNYPVENVKVERPPFVVLDLKESF